MMLSGGADASGLARDTVFAAVMIILNGLIGASLLVGGRRHYVQDFNLDGINAALGTLTVIVAFTLIVPNYSTSAPGPVYTTSQLAFVAVATLVLFGAFTVFQTIRHREYFLPKDGSIVADEHGGRPTGRETLTSLGLLLVALVAVVLSAKGISPTIEALIHAAGAPQATVGILIAAIVLLPESVAAVRAAHANRLQTSLNLAIGSAIASIGLTVPAVALLAIVMGWPLALGLDMKSTVLLVLSLFVVSISLRTMRARSSEPGVSLCTRMERARMGMTVPSMAVTVPSTRNCRTRARTDGSSLTSAPGWPRGTSTPRDQVAAGGGALSTTFRG